MSFIEKYRAGKFSEIKGQDLAIEKIKNFFKHFPEEKAIILHGPAGSGKTSLAYALAHEVEGEIIEKAIPRIVRSRSRWQDLTVTEATLKDSSDDVILILWNEQIKQCAVGDRVRIEGGYVKNYRGIRQLNVGKIGKLITLD